MATVGFVGLGIMGRPMLNNLLKAGHTVVAYGRNAAKLDACVSDGAQRGASNSDVGARASIVITMLPDGPEVEEVVLGANGILAGSRPGSLIVDMSSINPLVSQQIAAACAAKGVDFLDAPVSGGEPKAIEGTLAASAHQSHAYSDGACLYFTFGGRGPEGDDAWRERYYRQAWDTVTNATLAHGAAISHHHGIGLNRSRFLAEALGAGFEVLARLKKTFDPVGILNPGKLGLQSPFGSSPWQ